MTAQELLLSGATICDPQTGTSRRSDLLVGDGLIRQIDDQISVALEDCEILDCSGLFIFPGLIDAHVHLTLAGEQTPSSRNELVGRGMENARLLLGGGVTTARDVGGDPVVLREIVAAVNAGRGTGPDIRYAGQLICPPGGHGTEWDELFGLPAVVSDLASARSAVRHQVRLGATWVKVALNGGENVVAFPPALLQAVVDEAALLGVPVACHASIRDAIELAVDCGVDTIEHGNGLDLGLAQRMSERGICLVPTTCIFQELARALDAPGGLDEFSEVYAGALQNSVRRRVREHGPTVQAALTVGLPIALGTDRIAGAGVLAVVDEMMELVDRGMPLVTVLQAATCLAADTLRLPDRGRVEVGKRADLIVVAQSPFESLDALRSPVHVVAAGFLVDQPVRAACTATAEPRR